MNFKTSKLRTTLKRFGITVTGAKLWNELHTVIKQKSKHLSKKNIKSLNR